jgi:hypothetical protein
MDDSESIIKCGCFLVIALFNFLVGAWSVNYLLLVFLGKTIPFLGAALIGLFAGEISIPTAIVVWLLKVFGVM